ncbi:hypothetical protein VTL71DRAFT_8753 [Oculimacula yallundae]|uniref:Extracellular membrane protein CFEM domain-containing protein n=1 Tax=Oculimacula yallundae TaxID=86028 RepID=A0ABR4CYH5_9HELO
MQVFRAILLLCLSAACVEAASLNLTYLADLLDQVPQCGKECIIGLLNDVPVGLPDPNLICRNQTLQATAATCVFAKCDYVNQKQVAIVKRKFCAGMPIESRAWQVTIVGVVLASAAIMAVALRFHSRCSIVHSLGADDWLAFVAVLILIPYTVLNIYNGLVNGYGRHYWDLDPAKVQHILQFFYISELLYITTLTLVKSSMLVFYYRVFTPRWFVVADLMTLCVTIMAGLAIFICLVFQCSPIYGLWNPQLAPQCLNINTLKYASGAISVALDLIIIVLPIPVLINLKMGLKMKLSLFFMFGLGSLACVTAGIRLKYIVASFEYKNPIFHPLTGDNIMPAIWSFVEISVALICSCLPAIRALLSRWFPTVFDLTIQSSPNPEPTELPLSTNIDKALSYDNHYNPKEKSKSTFIEKVGPSYNKHSRIFSLAPSGGSVRSSAIFPQGLSSEFPGAYQPWGRGDSDTYNPQRVSFQRASFLQQNTHTRLDSPPAEDSEVKVWINPSFDAYGNPVESLRTPLTEDFRNSASASETSLWALEGPRVSDDLKLREAESWDQDHRYAELKREEEQRRVEERRISQALCIAGRGVVMKPVGVALPMKPHLRSGRMPRDEFQRALSPISSEMESNRF